MATGTVKWFNEQKGYGFIQPDDGGRDVFVHISAVERSGMRGLAEGQKISYELQADRRTGKESAANAIMNKIFHHGSSSPTSAGGSGEQVASAAAPSTASGGT